MNDVVAKDEELQALREKVRRMEDQNRMLQLKEEVLLNLVRYFKCLPRICLVFCCSSFFFSSCFQLAAAALDQQMFEQALLAVRKRHKQQQLRLRQ